MKMYIDMESESIYSESELKEFYHDEKDDRQLSYAEWMKNISWWNGGTIAEIKTDDTNKSNYTVSLYRLSWNDDTTCLWWLSPIQADSALDDWNADKIELITDWKSEWK